MEIRVNKDALIATGNNIIDKAKEFKFQIEQIKKLVEILKEHWQGKDMETYVEAMNNIYIPELENLCEVIEDYGSYLLDVKKEYDKLDEEPNGGNYE